MAWKKPAEIISRRTAERDQFLTPYTVRAPKARSTDAKPVVPDVFVIAPAVPTAPVETKPLPPSASSRPAAPAGPIAIRPSLFGIITNLFRKTPKET